jgi:hypothetical protein
MPLNQCSLQDQLQYLLQTTGNPIGPVSQGPLTFPFSLANLNVSSGNIDTFYANQITIAGSGNTDVDFYSFTDQIGEATGMRHIQALWVNPIGTDGVIIAPGSATALTWFFGGTSPTITVPPNGIFLFSIPAGGTLQVVDATHRKINFADASSGGTMVNIFAIGSSA